MIDKFEAGQILEALNHSKGNISRVAARFGHCRATIRKIAQRRGPPSFKRRRIAHGIKLRRARGKALAQHTTKKGDWV